VVVQYQTLAGARSIVSYASPSPLQEGQRISRDGTSRHLHVRMQKLYQQHLNQLEFDQQQAPKYRDEADEADVESVHAYEDDERTDQVEPVVSPQTSQQDKCRPTCSGRCWRLCFKACLIIGLPLVTALGFFYTLNSAQKQASGYYKSVANWPSVMTVFTSMRFQAIAADGHKQLLTQQAATDPVTIPFLPYVKYDRTAFFDTFSVGTFTKTAVTANSTLTIAALETNNNQSQTLVFPLVLNSGTSSSDGTSICGRTLPTSACAEYYVATAVCFSVDSTNATSFIFGGCIRSPPSPYLAQQLQVLQASFGASMPPVYREYVQYTAVTARPTTQQLRELSLALTIRSASDPWVTALVETSGRFDYTDFTSQFYGWIAAMAAAGLIGTLLLLKDLRKWRIKRKIKRQRYLMNTGPSIVAAQEWNHDHEASGSTAEAVPRLVRMVGNTAIPAPHYEVGMMHRQPSQHRLTAAGMLVSRTSTDPSLTSQLGPDTPRPIILRKIGSSGGMTTELHLDEVLKSSPPISPQKLHESNLVQSAIRRTLSQHQLLQKQASSGPSSPRSQASPAASPATVIKTSPLRFALENRAGSFVQRVDSPAHRTYTQAPLMPGSARNVLVTMDNSPRLLRQQSYRDDVVVDREGYGSAAG
jgi:hypothetical protein